MANEEKSFLDETGLSHLWSKLKQLLAGKESSGAAAAVQQNLESHTKNTTNPHGVTKAQVGLGNVDNTSDAAKPVSTAQATAIAEAKKAGTDAQANLTSHNTDTAAHSDLRSELKKLSDRIAAALDSDDETLDELSEIVAYIKSNKELIEAITTSKVSVADIVNDLVTNVANKPLSAAQGVALKKLIDDVAATIPNAYTHPSYTAKANGLYKVTVDNTGHVRDATAVAKSDITALGIPAQDTTIPVTSDPEADVAIWIDPNDDPSTEFYTKGETDALLAGMTYEDVGAAPAGYGYGELIYVHDDGDAFIEGIESLLSSMDNGLAMQLRFSVEYKYSEGASFFGTLYKMTDEYAILTGCSYHRSTYVYRAKYEGAWQPWEFVNPPMVPSVEYRTTERWDGKPVYTKLIECGNLPDIGTERTVTHNTGGKMIAITGHLSTGDVLPYINDVTEIKLSTTPKNIIIQTVNWGFSSEKLVTEVTATVRIWYIKD